MTDDETNNDEEETRDYIRVGEWMRENRKNSNYRTSVQAICELVDNSIEENANNIYIEIYVDNMRKGKIHKISVIDDGDGMDQDVLWDAVCENAGTRMDRRNMRHTGRKKLGKYGVGLPKASDSQCDTWEVYSWKKSHPKSAFHSEIDWSKGDFNNKIPKPIQIAVPQYIIDRYNLSSNKSGTILNSTKLGGPSFTWKTYKGLARNLKIELGRIYRKYLNNGSDLIDDELNIWICGIPTRGRIPEPDLVQPRDPLYLTENTGIVEPDFPGWKKGDALFKLEDTQTETIPVIITTLNPNTGNSEENTVEISVTASIVKVEARTVINGAYPGMFKWGQEINKNRGVSFCREGREIRLDARWCLNEPQERWWSLEYNFPEELDGLLAISTDKQDYTALSQMMTFDYDDIRHEGETDSLALDRLRIDEPGTAFIFELIQGIKDKVTRLRGLIGLQRPPRIRTKECKICCNLDCICKEPKPCKDCNNHPCACFTPEEEPDPEEEAEDIVDDKSEDLIEEKNLPAIEEYLRDFNVPDSEIERIRKNLIIRGRSWIITSGNGFGRSLLFSVDKRGGANLVVLNTDHPAYNHIFAGLRIDEGIPENISKEFKDKMYNARTAMFLLITAWAELERLAGEDERDTLSLAREDWGRKIREFINVMNKRRE